MSKSTMRRARCSRLPLPAAAFMAALIAVCAPGSARAEDGDLSTRTLAGGRTYQVLADPQAKGEANRPLVLYLSSPAGPNLDAFRKDYWPALKERKCVAAIPLAKSDKMWLAEDANYVERVLADVRKTDRTDENRLVLLGVSGGGQLGLFLADHAPEAFRAVVAIATNPVTVRGSKAEWFYPAESSLKKCPYFVVNPLTEGSALLYWRQVRESVAPRGGSITVWSVLGEANAHYLPPPKELWPWLDEVLAGRQPAALADPQAAAVAKMFQKPVAALAAELEKAHPAGAGAATTQPIVKEVGPFALRVPVPPDFERSKREDVADSAGRPIAQVRLEHAKDAIYIRCEARSSERGMKVVLAEEANQTALRGMLYQVYRTGTLAGYHGLPASRATPASRAAPGPGIAPADGGRWDYQIGSITFPHKDRGWQSTLFVHAWQPLAEGGKRWIEVTILDETQQPDGGQLANAIWVILSGLSAGGRN